MIKEMLTEKSVSQVSSHQSFVRILATVIVTSGSLLSQCFFSKSIHAQTELYCHFNQEEINTKEKLLNTSLQGDLEASQKYQATLQKHAEILHQCRSTTWPQEQAIWLRLYPCDVAPGSIDNILDRIVNKGYNKVYLEVFFDSQVLLPPNENSTPWISVVRSPGAENVDLLAQAIQKGHDRGLQVYAWMFTMNFGYTYAQRGDRKESLARNGQGEDSLNFVDDRSQAFIDPYSKKAQQDYSQLVQAILKRQPDGVLFDYIRYPRGSGNSSIVNQVKDLWIYGDASLQALYNRATNKKGLDLIGKYLQQGNISAEDIIAVDKLYPQEKSPLWQGRKASESEEKESASIRTQKLRSDLWYLSVAHAAQGVLDFLSFASEPVQRQGIPSGAVFFPGGNRSIGNTGFDSRLQAWNQFPANMEWHAMSYAICQDASCVVDEVKQVLKIAPQGTKVVPALAGVWGNTFNDHPSLEVQMQAIHQALPQVNSVSHFAFSWQELEVDRQRKFCHLQ